MLNFIKAANNNISVDEILEIISNNKSTILAEDIMEEDLINLTPHNIRIHKNGEVIKIVKPQKISARVSSKQNKVDSVDGVSIYKVKYGELKDLPQKKSGTYYIVSMAAAFHSHNRDDVIFPATGPDDDVIRKNGEVWAVSRFSKMEE